MTRDRTIMIIDDHPLMRRGIRQLLDTIPLFAVIIETSNSAEAVTLATHNMPDIILLDLNMKEFSGLDTLKILRKKGITSRIIVFTVSDVQSDVYSAIDTDINSYLLKNSEPELLLEHIHQPALSKRFFSNEMTDYLTPRPKQINPFSQLTGRELDVLQEVARGMSNKQVATELHISEETVKVHIRHLLRKLNAHSRVAATIMYLENKNDSR